MEALNKSGHSGLQSQEIKKQQKQNKKQPNLINATLKTVI